MRRQLAIFSALWFVVFCAVIGAVTFLSWVLSSWCEGLGGAPPLPTRILLTDPSGVWSLLWAIVAVAVVACLNGLLLRLAFRKKDERSARVFHAWALGIQAIALILFVCFALIAFRLPFLPLVPVIK